MMKITHDRSAAVEIVKIIITKSTLHCHLSVFYLYAFCIDTLGEQGLFFFLQIYLVIIEGGYFFRVIFPP